VVLDTVSHVEVSAGGSGAFTGRRHTILYEQLEHLWILFSLGLQDPFPWMLRDHSTSFDGNQGSLPMVVRGSVWFRGRQGGMRLYLHTLLM
jgi:hypothetical protein